MSSATITQLEELSDHQLLVELLIRNSEMQVKIEMMADELKSLQSTLPSRFERLVETAAISYVVKKAT